MQMKLGRGGGGAAVLEIDTHQYYELLCIQQVAEHVFGRLLGHCSRTIVISIPDHTLTCCADGLKADNAHIPDMALFSPAGPHK